MASGQLGSQRGDRSPFVRSRPMLKQLFTATGTCPHAAAAPGPQTSTSARAPCSACSDANANNTLRCGASNQALVLWAKRQRGVLEELQTSCCNTAVRHGKPPRNERGGQCGDDICRTTWFGKSPQPRQQRRPGSEEPKALKTDFCSFQVGSEP